MPRSIWRCRYVLLSMNTRQVNPHDLASRSLHRTSSRVLALVALSMLDLLFLLLMLVVVVGSRLFAVKLKERPTDLEHQLVGKPRECRACISNHEQLNHDPMEPHVLMRHEPMGRWPPHEHLIHSIHPPNQPSINQPASQSMSGWVELTSISHTNMTHDQTEE